MVNIEKKNHRYFFFNCSGSSGSRKLSSYSLSLFRRVVLNNFHTTNKVALFLIPMITLVTLNISYTRRLRNGLLDTFAEILSLSLAVAFMIHKSEDRKAYSWQKEHREKI